MVVKKFKNITLILAGSKVIRKKHLKVTSGTKKMIQEKFLLSQPTSVFKLLCVIVANARTFLSTIVAFVWHIFTRRFCVLCRMLPDDDVHGGAPLLLVVAPDVGGHQLIHTLVHIFAARGLWSVSSQRNEVGLLYFAKLQLTSDTEEVPCDASLRLL